MQVRTSRVNASFLARRGLRRGVSAPKRELGSRAESCWPKLRHVVSALLLSLITAIGCSDDDDGGDKMVDPTPDTTPPAAIVDLRSSTLTTTSITLNWTAPGDDGETGGAVAEYDLRYATEQLNGNNWQTATRWQTGAPSEPGFTERIVVSGLTPSTVYYFAVASVDDADHRSQVSNFHSVSTQAATDVIPPAAITDLAVGTVDSSSVELLWTATGDNGTSGTAFGYDILQLDRPITEDNYTEAGGPTTTPIPGPPGTAESIVVEDLQPSTTYYFAVIVWDESRNRSPVSNNVMVTTPAN